jgi:hypothetical protein
MTNTPAAGLEGSILLQTLEHTFQTSRLPHLLFSGRATPPEKAESFSQKTWFLKFYIKVYHLF